MTTNDGRIPLGFSQSIEARFGPAAQESFTYRDPTRLGNRPSFTLNKNEPGQQFEQSGQLSLEELEWLARGRNADYKYTAPTPVPLAPTATPVPPTPVPPLPTPLVPTADQERYLQERNAQREKYTRTQQEIEEKIIEVNERARRKKFEADEEARRKKVKADEEARQQSISELRKLQGQQRKIQENLAKSRPRFLQSRSRRRQGQAPIQQPRSRLAFGFRATTGRPIVFPRPLPAQSATSGQSRSDAERPFSAERAPTAAPRVPPTVPQGQRQTQSATGGARPTVQQETTRPTIQIPLATARNLQFYQSFLPQTSSANFQRLNFSPMTSTNFNLWRPVWWNDARNGVWNPNLLVHSIPILFPPTRILATFEFLREETLLCNHFLTRDLQEYTLFLQYFQLFQQLSAKLYTRTLTVKELYNGFTTYINFLFYVKQKKTSLLEYNPTRAKGGLVGIPEILLTYCINEVVFILEFLSIQSSVGLSGVDPARQQLPLVGLYYKDFYNFMEQIFNELSLVRAWIDQSSLAYDKVESYLKTQGELLYANYFAEEKRNIESSLLLQYRASSTRQSTWDAVIRGWRFIVSQIETKIIENIIPANFMNLVNKRIAYFTQVSKSYP